jgi:hypothetical protein
VDKLVEYWCVVTDPDGLNTVSSVFVDVYHPTTGPTSGPFAAGSFKYQILLTKESDQTAALAEYEAARDAGLVSYQTGYDDAEVLFEMDKGTAAIYSGSEYVDYHQPYGDYRVVCDAYDTTNAWASLGSPATSLENFFTYMETTGIELDFDTLNFGTVSVCSEKWIAGDTIWDTIVPAQPNPNPATVRNVGNTWTKVTVEFDDMGFGFSGAAGTALSGSSASALDTSTWNVTFDARRGSDPANAMWMDPNVEVTLPNELHLCNTDELDFSIHVKKSPAGDKTGTMVIGCVKEPFA